MHSSQQWKFKPVGLRPLAVVAVANTLAFVVAATMAVDAVDASLAVAGLVTVVSAVSLVIVAVAGFTALGSGCGIWLWMREEHLLRWQLTIFGK